MPRLVRPLFAPPRPAAPPRPIFPPPPTASPLPGVGDLDDLTLARLGATVLRELITRGAFVPRVAGARQAPGDLWLVMTERGTALELHLAGGPG